MTVPSDGIGFLTDARERVGEADQTLFTAGEGLLSVAVTSFLANPVLKRAVPRQRPKDPVPDARELPDPDSSSFPSGHMASVAAVGFSRVYTGVHHPSDVAVGWILGKAVAAVVRRTGVVPKLMFRLED